MERLVEGGGGHGAREGGWREQLSLAVMGACAAQIIEQVLPAQWLGRGG
jgi:hypothetical protein